MANSINSISTGTGGLQSTADGTSGNLLIQKDAGTIATFSSTGVVVSGVVAATTLTGDGSALTGISSGGLTQLASFATTSGTTVVSPTLDLSTYKFLYITQDGVGWTSDTGGVQIVTPNGGSSVQWTAGTGPTNSLHGLVMIDLSTGIGSGTSLTGVAGSIINVTGGVASFKNTGISTSTTSLTFGTDGAVDFVRGSMKLYGLK